MRFSILSFFSLLASLLLSTGAVAEHAGEQKKQNNAAVGVAGDLSLEEAAKIYFATMLISVEHPEVNKKLAAELSKKLADSDSKIVGSIDPNAIKSSSVPTAILSSIFFSAVMDPGQTGKHLPAASGLSLLSSGSSVCTSSFLPHKLADYKNGLLKKNGKDFDKTIDRESLTKAVQDEVTVRSGLLGKMLQWSPEQEQKFASAYRNAIYVSFETHSGQLYEEYDPKQPPGTESWELSPGKVNSRSELPNVIDVIEKNKLASKTEIAELEEDEKAEFLEAVGMEEPGLNRVIRAGYNLLGLHTYFTAGVKEVRAWTIPLGATAPQAAGKIHTDFEKGFIRAEVIAYEDYIHYKGEQGAKDAGKWRLEGKTYIMNDGDVVHFRFNV
jgi:hypothetical protein